MYRSIRRSAVFLTLVTSLILLAGFSTEISGMQDKPKSKSLNILTLGDSNGALPFGWVFQLKQIRTNDTVFSISISGNTIGFDNNGRTSLNTVRNIDGYMDQTYKKLAKIDRIIIMLGTNDCKSVFKDSLQLVPGNMKKIISEIKRISKIHKDKPVIYIVSPPPFGPDDMLEEKYKGGLDRVSQLNAKLELVAKEESVIFINAFQILAPVFRQLTTDGVHLNADGQRMIALIIQENIKY